MEHIKKKTSITVDVLSNSEQRFLSYKSIASKGEDFERTIETGTAIVDVGGGSIQLSLFDKDTLVTTTNLLLGSLRVSGRIAQLENQTAHPDVLIDQLIRKDILNFKRMYLKDRNIDTIILVGDYFTNLIFQNRADANKFESREEFLGWYDKIVNMTAQEAAEFLGVGMEVAHAVLPTAVLYKRLIEVLGVKTVWLPGIQLTDGIAFDYGLTSKIIRSSHDFDRDILSAARNIMKRYAGNKPHTDKLLEVSDEIFRAVRKSNLLSDRDRLLLKVACYLHDCGKYVSLVDVAACSYNIIKSTEIIGLSDRERMIIANVVRYNTVPLDFRGNPAYEDQARDMLPEDLIRVAKLTAILRLANGLDQSYLQKITEIRATRKEEKLIIEVVVKEDFTLEKGIFAENVTFFEDIFDVKPVLKIKKKLS
jgi:exopolyphosphatase/guanosine-5'-triphosphate,3'-diphosphate pyrophosphatase